MKMHMEFVLIFITGQNRAKLGRPAWEQLLTLASLYIGFKFLKQVSTQGSQVQILAGATISLFFQIQIFFVNP